jgi:cytochrome c peroxidase
VITRLTPSTPTYGKGRIQLGKKFTAGENAKIVAFLKTLTGDQPDFRLPILAPSSDNTPRPQPLGKKQSPHWL